MRFLTIVKLIASVTTVLLHLASVCSDWSQTKEQWELGNWAEGCKRKLPLKCRDGDRFFRLRDVKFPIFYSNIENSSVGLEDCKVRCLSNCSCTAYASTNGNATGCLLWFRELMGLQDSSDGLQELYVCLVASELNQASCKNNLHPSLFT